MAVQALSPIAFKSPAIALSGVVDYSMYTTFRTQFDNAAEKDLVVIELSTLGGDPEVARMMGEDIRFASAQYPERRFVFLGKAAIYSAGTTFMSFFTRENRYLTRGTDLVLYLLVVAFAFYAVNTYLRFRNLERRFTDFAALTPTVQIDPQRGSISFAGQRGINGNVMVDGADYNNPFFGGTRGGEHAECAREAPRDERHQPATAAHREPVDAACGAPGVVSPEAHQQAKSEQRGSGVHIARGGRKRQQYEERQARAEREAPGSALRCDTARVSPRPHERRCHEERPGQQVQWQFP